jgi:23S rRNA (uracil1939-C5)-methyltransferase
MSANAAPTSATPRCPHFGVCGGCRFQDVTYEEQLRLKRVRLAELLHAAGFTTPEITIHAGEPYEYRNRIRLRVERIDAALRFGYNRSNTTEFLPIVTCPIAALVLWQTVEALLAAAQMDDGVTKCLVAASHIELFCSDDLARVQLTLLYEPRTTPPRGAFNGMMQALTATAPQITSAAAVNYDARTGLPGRTLESWGANGIAYRAANETYWISRGAFFQVNRFLIGALIRLVCDGRSGSLAWDLFAGVGLFSRVLAHSFAQVTAVEANAVAAADLRAALAKLGPEYNAVQATTLEFLRDAVVQRDRPELIVLDPPRAGAGAEACELLLRVDSSQIIYVSCEPTTLARDIAALQPRYRIAALHMVDLFPQTEHLETVVVLERNS